MIDPCRHRWIQELGPDTPELSHRIRQREQRARSVSLLADAQGVLTLTDSATMGQAVVADMGTSLLVIANGLRLLRQRWA